MVLRRSASDSDWSLLRISPHIRILRISFLNTKMQFFLHVQSYRRASLWARIQHRHKSVTTMMTRGAAKPPKPLPPPVLLAEFSAHLRFCGGARQVARVGGGALMGVFRVKFLGGRVGVGPPYLPFPPPLDPRNPSRARSGLEPGVERRGRGRGRSGIVGPPFTPLPLARPRRK